VSAIDNFYRTVYVCDSYMLCLQWLLVVSKLLSVVTSFCGHLRQEQILNFGNWRFNRMPKCLATGYPLAQLEPVSIPCHLSSKSQFCTFPLGKKWKRSWM